MRHLEVVKHLLFMQSNTLKEYAYRFKMANHQCSEKADEIVEVNNYPTLETGTGCCLIWNVNGWQHSHILLDDFLII